MWTIYIRWVVEVSDRKFVRQLPDEVAIVYARGALGENARGLLEPEQTFLDWSSFLEHLKGKLMTDSLQYKLVWESQHVKTRDWPRLVQIMSTYKMFVGKQFDGALMVSLIGNMPDHIRVKVIKKQPTSLAEAIDLGWKYHQREPQPTAPQVVVVHHHTPSPSSSSKGEKATEMDLDSIQKAVAKATGSNPFGTSLCAITTAETFPQRNGQTDIWPYGGG